ncbi:unnamed protein product [Prorocentrum cordatum]|uniref:Uncharacterized protein n=1 Tax=Prorocentrum cordatum TaxID=2364126 RepID=A0ABN9YAY7_9DINO|nr:unnamed protein product [Polarella glacialis]
MTPLRVLAPPLRAGTQDAAVQRSQGSRGGSAAVPPAARASSAEGPRARSASPCVRTYLRVAGTPRRPVQRALSGVLLGSWGTVQVPPGAPAEPPGAPSAPAPTRRSPAPPALRVARQAPPSVAWLPPPPPPSSLGRGGACAAPKELGRPGGAVCVQRGGSPWAAATAPAAPAAAPAPAAPAEAAQPAAEPRGCPAGGGETGLLGRRPNRWRRPQQSPCPRAAAAGGGAGRGPPSAQAQEESPGRLPVAGGGVGVVPLKQVPRWSSHLRRRSPMESTSLESGPAEAARGAVHPGPGSASACSHPADPCPAEQERSLTCCSKPWCSLHDVALIITFVHVMLLVLAAVALLTAAVPNPAPWLSVEVLATRRGIQCTVCPTECDSILPMLDPVVLRIVVVLDSVVRRGVKVLVPEVLLEGVLLVALLISLEGVRLQLPRFVELHTVAVLAFVVLLVVEVLVPGVLLKDAVRFALRA